MLAHIDSSQFDAAIEVAQTMQENFVDTQWATWAERATYEIQNLLPGMEAPNFAVRDANGDSLSLQDLRGKHVILEFYRPRRRPVPARTARSQQYLYRSWSRSSGNSIDLHAAGYTG